MTLNPRFDAEIVLHVSEARALDTDENTMTIIMLEMMLQLQQWMMTDCDKNPDAKAGFGHQQLWSRG